MTLQVASSTLAGALLAETSFPTWAGIINGKPARTRLPVMVRGSSGIPRT